MTIIDHSRFIDEQEISRILEANRRPEPQKIREVLAKASEMKGLNLEEVAVLTGISDPSLLHELFETANRIKETIYGKRLVIFAPLYISNLCANECVYCAIRAKTKRCPPLAQSGRDKTRNRTADQPRA
jgi:2-iminoacetate synthase